MDKYNNARIGINVLNEFIEDAKIEINAQKISIEELTKSNEEMKKSIEEKDELIMLFQTKKVFSRFRTFGIENELHTLQAKQPHKSLTNKLINCLFQQLVLCNSNNIELYQRQHITKHDKVRMYVESLPLLQSHQINKVFNNGHTLLTMCASMRDWTIVGILLSHQPFINIKHRSRANKTILDYAMETYEILEKHEKTADVKYVMIFNEMFTILCNKREYAELHCDVNS